MYLNNQSVEKILAHLENDKSIAETKKVTTFNLKEIKYAVKQLLVENGEYYNPDLHKKIMAREKEYEEQQEKLKNQALDLIELDGNLEKAKKQTGLSLVDINERLKRLKKEDAEREEKIQSKIQEFNTQKEEFERNLDEAIISLILQKVPTPKIMSEKKVSRNRVEKAIERLNRPKTSDIYLKVKAVQKETIKEARKRNMEILLQKTSHSKLMPMDFIIDKIVANEMTVEEASIKYNRTVSDILVAMREITNPQKAQIVAPILANYPNFYTPKSENTQGKSLTKYSLGIQKEIVLIALTYRVSYKNLAKLFHTTIEDVIFWANSFIELKESFDYLDVETRHEEEEISQVAYLRAKNYLWERNNLVKELVAAKKEQNIAQVEQIKEKQKKLHTKIDDTLVWNCIEKNAKELTMAQRNAIARHRIKYGLSLKETMKVLHKSRDFINKCEQELAAIDPVYKGKLECLKNLGVSQFDRRFKEAKKTENATNATFDFFLKEPINLEYFNFTPQTNSLESSIEENRSRGGGTR